ncbi:MAG: 50S ribosomal protein L24e [Nanoarchaeota archaeon]
MKCTFCEQEIAPGTGKMFVRKEGKILYFCSKKCEKNLLKLNRKSRETKWVTKRRKP